MLLTQKSNNLLDIKHLNANFKDGFALKNISLGIKKSQRVALVGESGSGKSLIANLILSLQSDIKIQSGEIQFEESNLINTKSIQKIRGKEIAYIAQEPLSSLNPLQKSGKQIAEALKLHSLFLSKKEILKRVDEVFIQVGLDPMLKNAYPYELSGGQCQRIAIGMGIINHPKLLICDEPTTALDASIQKQILELLKTLNQSHKIAILLITHDLAVVKDFAEDVYVANKGEICEYGRCEDIFKNPQNPYTQKLLDALKLPQKKIKKNTTEVLSVKNFSISYFSSSNLLLKKEKQILQDINFTLNKCETLGIVGESGSGKSTLALGLLRLIKSNGEEYINNIPIHTLSLKNFKPYRKNIQIIFQDPYASLNPKMLVRDVLKEPFIINKQSVSENDLINILESVGLEENFLDFYPYELSGGQRQRICIARAIALKPDIIILDEPTSALDKSMQKIVLKLLLKLQQEFLMSYIFISHDLEVIEAISDEVLVLKDGKIVEKGSTKDIFKNPQAKYTKLLLNSRII